MNSSDNLITLRKVESTKQINHQFDWEEFSPLVRNVSSPCEEEVVVGYLLVALYVGQPVIVQRTQLSGEHRNGLFVTNPITNITDHGFETKDAKYEIEYIKNNSSYII